MSKTEALPLYERKHLKNTIPRLIELTILFLCFSLLGYRLLHLKNHGFIWLVALLCESWFTFIWILVVNIKWNPIAIKTYPERLLQRNLELPPLDMFVTTADPVLEPPIITVNTVISLLSMDYPANKLACYLSDDAASPLTYFCLVEASEFAKLWIPFCKKYNVPVRAPFRYFSDQSLFTGNSSSEFQEDWNIMKDEYRRLCQKIEEAAQKSVPCELTGDFAAFVDIDRRSHPTIIKVISENKEGLPDGLPPIVYISREKRPNHAHHFKAGAMNVLARVSGVMTNAPFMLNVDCDMFANNPQVVLHAMCLLLGVKDETDSGFVQFPQQFYDGLKDDPFGNQMVVMTKYLGRGLAGHQGHLYGGTGCFHRRKIIYGSSPEDKSGKMNIGDLEKTFGKSTKFNKFVAQALSSSSRTAESPESISKSIDEACQVASCGYEYGTAWGKEIGWIYGSITEDVLTGLNIHWRGWRTMWLRTNPKGFLGCAPSCGPNTLIQQKRSSTGLLEILFTPKSPFLGTLFRRLEFRQCLVYLYFLLWGPRSIFEICYAALPAYCILTNTNFLPKVNEPAILIPISIFVIFNTYCVSEYIQTNQSIKSWWNNHRMARIIAMTAWLCGFLSVIFKILRLSETVFEVTKKEQSSSIEESDEKPGRFTFDNSPVFVPGTTILMVNLTALGIGFLDFIHGSEGKIEWGIGELVCSIWVVLCFWSFLKGLLGKGKYGIPSSIVCKSAALVFVFVQICRSSWGI
ncbi:cellulose synthase-like protein H1 isoform X1 [Coffea arabica]|uniref:Cellulose synthase-like protein H1 isoform X1 n=1 Tax=Coffea arabica TaxID=13443 RepID=A0A6P6XHH8_COFAR